MEPVSLLKGPSKPPVKPPPRGIPPPPPEGGKFSFGQVRPAIAQRVGIYGPGGIGKSSCSCRAPGPVAIFDFDDALPVLRPALQGLDLRVVGGVESWSDLRDALHDPEMWIGIRTIVIDSLTRVEQLAIAHTLATVTHEKGQKVSSIEGYGFGKGYRHVFETFLPLLADLDQHLRAGRNVVVTMHECTANVPNPDGVDYIRWEPRLQNQANGNIRLATKEWLDHLLCIRLDITAKPNERGEKRPGKAAGGDTRTIYPVESAVHMAKSRSLKDSFVYEEGSDELWRRLFA